MDPFIASIIAKVTDPYFLVLVAIVAGLMKMVLVLLGSIEKRDKIIENLRLSIDNVKAQLASNREVQSSILKLVEVLIYGRRGGNNGKD